MTKKRVLIIYRSYFPSLSHLGPATAIRNLISNMSEHYDFHILTLNFEFATGAHLFDEPCHIDNSGPAVIEYIPRGFAGYRILMRRLREGFDIVDIQCAFDPLLSIPALLLCRFGMAPTSRIFHTPHGIFMDVIMSANRTRKALFCRFSDLLGLYRNVTHLAGSSLEEADIGRSHRRAQTIDTVSQFVESIGMPDAPRAKQPSQLRIAFVGRVTLQKNLVFALEVLRQLDVPSSLDIFGEVGDDLYARRCVEMVEAGIGQCTVTFKGSRPKPQLFAELPTYDILFHPTSGENFGHAIVEALGLGIPVLISDKNPWIDVAEFNAGWALPVSQPTEFCKRLEQIFEMGDGWSSLSNGAIRYFNSTFDRDRTACRYRRAYG